MNKSEHEPFGEVIYLPLDRLFRKYHENNGPGEIIDMSDYLARKREEKYRSRAAELGFAMLRALGY